MIMAEKHSVKRIQKNIKGMKYLYISKGLHFQKGAMLLLSFHRILGQFLQRCIRPPEHPEPSSLFVFLSLTVRTVDALITVPLTPSAGVGWVNQLLYTTAPCCCRGMPPTSPLTQRLDRQLFSSRLNPCNPPKTF